MAIIMCGSQPSRHESLSQAIMHRDPGLSVLCICWVIGKQHRLPLHDMAVGPCYKFGKLEYCQLFSSCDHC